MNDPEALARLIEYGRLGPIILAYLLVGRKATIFRLAAKARFLTAKGSIASRWRTGSARPLPCWNRRQITSAGAFNRPWRSLPMQGTCRSLPLALPDSRPPPVALHSSSAVKQLVALLRDLDWTDIDTRDQLGQRSFAISRRQHHSCPESHAVILAQSSRRCFPVACNIMLHLRKKPTCPSCSDSRRQPSRATLQFAA